MSSASVSLSTPAPASQLLCDCSTPDKCGNKHMSYFHCRHTCVCFHKTESRYQPTPFPYRATKRVQRDNHERGDFVHLLCSITCPMYNKHPSRVVLQQTSGSNKRTRPPPSTTTTGQRVFRSLVLEVNTDHKPRVHPPRCPYVDDDLVEELERLENKENEDPAQVKRFCFRGANMYRRGASDEDEFETDDDDDKSASKKRHTSPATAASTSGSESEFDQSAMTVPADQTEFNRLVRHFNDARFNIQDTEQASPHKNTILYHLTRSNTSPNFIVLPPPQPPMPDLMPPSPRDAAIDEAIFSPPSIQHLMLPQPCLANTSRSLSSLFGNPADSVDSVDTESVATPIRPQQQQSQVLTQPGVHATPATTPEEKDLLCDETI